MSNVRCRMDHQPFTPALLLVLLVARVIVDLMAIGAGKTSYRLDFASFLVFLAAGFAILAESANDLWGFLALGVALFSLGQCLIRRSRYSRNKPTE